MSLTPKDTHSGGPPAAFPYPLENSALLSGTQYMSWTPSSAGDQQKFTFSCWLKPCKDAGQYDYIDLLGVNTTSTSGYGLITISHSNNLLEFVEKTSANNVFRWHGSPELTDQTGHYHIVVSVNTNATDAADRLTIYLNGKVLPGAYEAVPPKGHMSHFNKALTHVIGTYQAQQANGRYSDCYLSDVYFIDGQTLGPTEFGEQSRNVTNLWIPKAYTGTYSGNSFHLDFSNLSNMGKDTSGMGNNLTLSGTPEQTKDTPTNNHCTWNSLATGNITYSMGNTKAACGVTGYRKAIATMPVQHMSYFELQVTGSSTTIPSSTRRLGLGFQKLSTPMLDYGAGNDGGYFVNPLGETYFSSSSKGTMYANILDYGVNDRLGFAIRQNGNDVHVWIRKNDEAWANGGNPETNETPSLTVVNARVWDLYPAVQVYNSTDNVLILTGSCGFDHDCPDGFNPICAKNAPEPTIRKSSTVAALVQRVGNGTNGDVTLPDMMGGPDWVNIKSIDDGYNWMLFDTTRGATKALSTNNDKAQTGSVDFLSSFNEDGYSLGNSVKVNQANYRFIDTCLKKGADQGFDILRYTGDGTTSRALPHNLLSAPKMALVKGTGAVKSWAVYHNAMGKKYNISLNDTAAKGTNTTTWASSLPTSTSFYVGSSNNTNQLGYAYNAYLFADSDIFTVFSYTGNGSADGPFVDLGGRPLSIPFLKSASSISDWLTLDGVRDPFNPVSKVLYPNDFIAENTATTANLTFTTRGFKVSTNWSTLNKSGDLFIGLAILESTKYSNSY